MMDRFADPTPMFAVQPDPIRQEDSSSFHRGLPLRAERERTQCRGSEKITTRKTHAILPDDRS